MTRKKIFTIWFFWAVGWVALSAALFGLRHQDAAVIWGGLCVSLLIAISTPKAKP